MNVRRFFGVLVYLSAACGGTVLLGSPMDGGTSPCVAAGGACLEVDTDCHSTGPNLSCGTAGQLCCGAHPTTGTDDTSGSDDTSGDDTSGDDVSEGDDADGGDDVASVPFDAAILDAPLADSSGSPITTFEFIMGGVVQQPMSCPRADWVYDGVSGQSAPNVYIRNAGDVPLAYSAAAGWVIPGMYEPGVPTGVPPELNGVLSPGEAVNITSVFEGGCVALLGASKPFTVLDGGFAPSDEETIPWPSGVAGSGGATTMYVAEIQVRSGCTVGGIP
jgi:hypothetical protein